MKFDYFVPTRIVAGEDCVRQSAPLLAGLGRRALIVTGRRSARACGALEDAEAALRSNGQSWSVFDEVEPNPSVPCVYAGAARAKREGADFVVAIGGGSPMDAAKAIALLARQDIPEDRLFLGGFGADVLPMAHVPTTAGTGSEVTQYSVLTNEARETKMSISGPMLFPRLALLDEKYLARLPREVAVNTAVDALSHAMEGMLSVRAGALSDLLALDAIGRIGVRLGRLSEGACTAEDRAELLLGSSLAGMVIANTGTTAVHAMGYPLTYYRGIDHGRANGLVLGEFLKFAEARAPGRVSALLAPLGMTGAEEFDALLRRLLGARERLTDAEIVHFAERSAGSKNVRNCVAAASRDDLERIFARAFRE